MTAIIAEDKQVQAFIDNLSIYEKVTFHKAFLAVDAGETRFQPDVQLELLSIIT